MSHAPSDPATEPLYVTTIADTAHFAENNALHWMPRDTAAPLRHGRRAVLVHAGDLSDKNCGPDDALEKSRVVRELNRHAGCFDHVVVVPGNHDACLLGLLELHGSMSALSRNGGRVHDVDSSDHRADQALVRAAIGAGEELAHNVHILVAGGVRIDGWCFYGLALQHTKRKEPFFVERDLYVTALQQIPEDEPRLVVVSHFPPNGHGDLHSGYGGNAGQAKLAKCLRTGCPMLRNRLIQVGPALTVVGHIHSDGGTHSSRGDYVRYGNAAVHEGNFRAREETDHNGQPHWTTFDDPRSVDDVMHAKLARAMVKDIHQLRLWDADNIEYRTYRSTATDRGLCAHDRTMWNDGGKWHPLRGAEHERKKRKRDEVSTEVHVRGGKRSTPRGLSVTMVCE